MMKDDERFELVFDHAWEKLHTELYSEIKQLIKQRWDGKLESASVMSGKLTSIL